MIPANLIVVPTPVGIPAPLQFYQVRDLVERVQSIIDMFDWFRSNSYSIVDASRVLLWAREDIVSLFLPSFSLFL